ncbi:hypothetical protein RKD39_000241 [Streptomyces albogriseolus]
MDEQWAVLEPLHGQAVGGPPKADRRRPAAGAHWCAVTRGAGSPAAALAMVFKLVESAQARWRAITATSSSSSVLKPASKRSPCRTPWRCSGVINLNQVTECAG